MPPLPESARTFQLKGPCWVATVEVLELADPSTNLSFRNLFLDTTGRSRLGRDSLHLPGTMLVLGAVQQVTVTDTPYRWERRNAVPSPQTPEQIQTAVQIGTLSLLLVQADPEAWPQQFPERNNQPFFPELTCLVGEIYLDALTPTSSSTVENLYNALQLQPSVLGSRDGAAHLLSTLTVHGSGLSIYGQIELPWETDAIAAPFQLTKQIIAGRDDRPLRLTLERERFTPAEQQAWSTAWNRLSRYLNPLNPQNGASQTAAVPTPNWVTLEITDPNAVPNLLWTLDTWGAERVLNFDPNEINILLSDQQPYNQISPPTSLGKLVPAWVMMDKTNGQLRVLVGAGENVGAPSNPASSANTFNTASRDNTVEYQFAGISPAETFAMQGLTVALDPTGTPQALRQDQQLSAPQWSDQTGPLEESLLWGFMVLEDGWAQLPIPNLTEQIYLDSGVANIAGAATTSGPLQGAVSLGNSRRSILENHPNEQPWNLTLTSLDTLQGQWLLNPEDDGFTLAEVNLLIQQPDITVTGLVWLSTGRPRIEDALPDLENWVTGVRSHSLRTTQPDTDLFPALATFNLDTLTLAARSLDTAETTAQLQTWKLLYAVHEPTFNAFVTQQVLKNTTFSQNLAWIWQRHPALPMVQALPLTQNQSPPNYPSASRQLIPFELPINGAGLPDQWYFGVVEGDGAVQWPQFLGGSAPAREWSQLADLPLVALSLPGLVLEPTLTSGSSELDSIAQLAPAYRFDLPYTDELNALAELPTTSPPPDQTSPLPDGVPPEPPQPLVRNTFADHWQTLSQLASLAAADAVTAFSGLSTDATAEIQTLIEPLSWTVQPTMDLTDYPGRLTLANADSSTIAADASPLDISSLEGISGRFNGSGATPFQITAGSLAAHAEDDGLRDQRGLTRFASQQPTTQLVQTPLTFQRTATESSAYALTSLLTALSLNVGSTAAPWQLWFRDIPINTSNNRFSQRTEGDNRNESRSAVAEDINDPEAFSRNQNFLSGYEWRLASQSAGATAAFLPLFNLRFYPLVLESVEIDGTQITKIDIVGRLQLPLTDDSELTDLSNAVRLTFAGDPLRLDDITLLADENEWPLALQAGETINAPFLVWRGVSLHKDSSGNPTAVALGDVRLQFFLFNTAWSLPLSAPLEFPAGAPTTVTAAYDFALANDTSLAPETVAIALNLATAVHAVDLALVVRLGQLRSPAVGLRTAAERVPFTARLSVPLLATTAQADTIPAVWNSATLFDDLNLIAERLVLSATALQFQWQTYTPREAAPQFLAGMALDNSQAPGFAAVTFKAVTSATADGAIFPTLQLQTAVVELLLTCQWGEFLQTANGVEQASDSNLTDQVFKSSAGSLVVGYTTQWQTDTWQETFLLNGFLEVTNLISWPQDLTYSSEDDVTVLSFPALPSLASGLRALSHRRHTIRILFNQHQIPSDLLIVAPEETLFQFAPDQAWQLLAVVEHQLMDIQAGSTQLVERLTNDRRWTTVQEVRLATPQRFRQFLESLGGSTVDPVLGIATLGDANQGYFSAQVRSHLTDALNELPTSTLLVEASAPHWVNQSPVATTSATTLQFLPNGNQLGILSNPQDYGPSDPRSPQWLLLTMPFLGRLQHTPADESPSPLQIDPVRLLATAETPSPLTLAFTHWVEDIPREMLVSGLDTAPGRTWARLDPLTLEESWFRLQNPLAEPTSTSILQSVLAAFPNTPARLSRSTALRYAFNPARPNSPPVAAGQPQPPVAIDQSLVWREDSLLAASDSFISDGLQVLYTFEEGSGNQINDVSGVSDSPLHLQILTETNSQTITEWIPGGGLRIKADTLIRSLQPATRLTAACQSTNEITIAVWVKPASSEDNPSQPLPQNGPARIVSLSKNAGNRSVTLGQDFPPQGGENFYLTRLRTTETSRNGLIDGNRPVVQVDNVVPDLVPIFFTRKSDGTTRLYTTDASGAIVEVENTVGGTFREWDDTYHLLLANEQKGEGRDLEIDDRRAWLGEYHQVAIYSRALSPTEVRRHIQRGLRQSRPVSPQQPLGWHLTGLQLLSSNLLSNTNSLNHHVAATLIPARLMVAGQPNEMPLSLAVSPYLGMEFRAAAAANLSLVSTELLCLDRSTGTLSPVASRLEELPSDRSADAVGDVRDRSLLWARETHQRLAPESAIALLRFRQISRAQSTATVSYAFAIVADLQRPQPLSQQVFRLRATPQNLRFREGQFGGSQLPQNLRSFEVAPPQITGVQPLYLQERPATASGSTTWPWGLSALRLSVQYTEEKQAAIGAVNDAGRWWQAPHHSVQFRSAASTDKPTAGLPPNFRAAAIRGLLPVLPDIPLPSEPDSPTQPWQPVLPGALTYLLTGNRPGVPFAIRHQLIAQTNRSTVVSGSIPIQHRMPRPVPLPENTATETALHTWASHFQITKSSFVSAHPADTAFFARCGTDPARGLQMVLQAPTNGAITSNWNGDLVFALTSNPAQTVWDIQVEIVDGSSIFTYRADGDAGRFVLDPPEQIQALRDLLSGQALGETISVSASVKPSTTNDSFQQTLLFPLRITDTTTLPLPLRPRFILFEDPEYNRLLISNAAHATGNVPVGTGNDIQIHEVKLSADRREYNSGSTIFLRYDWSGAIPPINAELKLARISSTGAVTQLRLPTPLSSVIALSIEPSQLQQFSLAEIQQLNTLELAEGDRLEIKLILRAENDPTADPVEVVLSVDIIDSPVIPVTQAAYGLLRHDRSHVECVRFAWSPEPTRIDLICPEDLQTEVVRRRAVFQWTDSIRPEASADQPPNQIIPAVSYEIQKITQTGSTGQPKINE